ncbi:hypothetical protein CL617_00595 [archaeon]|nr:hypothetical protein [archaeon]|tara:strand:- start:1171 stop:1494 length:324 start_codon:yes stop_codon:yes gene_type:complete
MFEKEEDDYIDSFSKWEILSKIALLKLKKSISLSDLARKIDVSTTNPYFHRIIGFLIDKNIIHDMGNIGRNRMIQIDRRKIIEFTYNYKFYDIPIDFLEKTKAIHIT